MAADFTADFTAELEINDREVDRRLAVALGRQVRRGRVLSGLGIPMVAIVLLGQLEPLAIALWTAVMVAEAAIAFVHTQPLLRRMSSGDVDADWSRRTAPHYVTFGLAWGSLSLFSLIGDRPSAIWMTTVITLAVLTVFVVTTSAHRRMFVLGLIGLNVPLAIAVGLSDAAPRRLLPLLIAYVGITALVHDALHGSLVGSMRSRRAAERLAERLNEFVEARDPATQLLNRRSFIAHLDRALTESGGQIVTVEVANVRRLTAINELYGEQFGDALIAHIGAQLRSIDNDGFAARLSGDEFAVARFGDHGADFVRAAAGGTFALSGATATIDFQCAATRSDRAGTQAEEIVAEALYALRAERSGRGIRSEIRADDSSLARRELLEELRAGLSEAGVVPWFQPIVDATTREVVAWEALVRWEHPVLGMVPPARLLPLIEMSGMSAQLFELMVDGSLQFLARLDALGAEPHAVHVNVNATELRVGSLADTVLGALHDSRIAAERLVLELTEREILHIDQTVRMTLMRLDAAGVHLAVDDFGTGYSSLTHLLDFPADHVKIDRRFIGGLPDDTDALALARGIVSMAHGLGLTTVAEGVETEEAAQAVEALGCDQIQGYLVSAARPAADAMEWLFSVSGQRSHAPAR